jgi:TRAP-type C4-dicarboxylate transport system permease small subunit
MAKKILNVYDNIVKGILVAIVAAFIIIVFVQVIFRYVLNNSLSWSEELARILFTQMIFLASPIAVLEKRHIAVDIVLQYLPRAAKRWVYVVINVLTFVFFCFLAVSGYTFAVSNIHQLTAAMGIPVGYLYMIIPVSCVMMCINCIRAGVDDFFVAYAPENKEGGAKK